MPKLALVFCLLAACAHQAPPAAWCSAELHHSTESVTEPLAALNQAFLQSHADARAQRCQWLEHEALVIRYASGTFEARYQGRVLAQSANILPAPYHPLKDVSHALFLAALVSEPGRQHATQVIATLQHELARPDSSTSASVIERERQLRILQHAQAAIANPANLKSELAAAYPDLNANIEAVANATLAALHEHVQAVRAQVPPEAWAGLLVVVSVAHQARAEALEVQYFERLLNEPVKEGARGEKRLVVTENLAQPSAQYGALAMHLVDQRGGQQVFGDPARLQRDVLHTSELDVGK